jgi:hypothetical protein
MAVRLFTTGVLLVMLASCGAPPTAVPSVSSPTSMPSPTTPATDIGINPLDWLKQSPFEPMPSVLPEIITTNLPEGFYALEPGLGNSELPGGHLVQVIGVEYQRPVGGQIYIENHVTVQFFSYDSLAGRTEYLDMLSAQDYTWNFEEVSNQRVARYHTSGADGRVWMSGPFLIVVFSGLDDSERGPWVDTFTKIYLEQFPPP